MEITMPVSGVIYGVIYGICSTFFSGKMLLKQDQN